MGYDIKAKLKSMRAAGGGQPDKIKQKVCVEFKDCPECHGTFYRDDGSICNCMRLNKIHNQLRRANVPARYFDVDLEFYKEHLKKTTVILRPGLQSGADKNPVTVREFVRFIDSYARNFGNRLRDGKSFVICGGTGCGKTGACCYLVREVMLSGHSAYYIDTHDLLDTISVWYGGEADERSKAKQKLDSLKKYDLLILDDIGSEYSKNKSWLYDRFLDLIKSRYMELKPTVITSNASPDNLLSGFDDDMAGRLRSVLSEFQILFLQNAKDVRVVKANRSPLYRTLGEEG